MILVTGGTGLVGSHLLYHLAASGCRVRAIRRPGSNSTSLEHIFSYYTPRAKELAAAIEWVDADLLDVFSLADAMEGVTEVFHCAAVISFVPALEKSMLKTNIEGTANVMNAALEKNIKKLCHVSSIAALGFQEDKKISEVSFWKSSPQNSVYSISKYGAEREAWRAMEEGLDVVIVNPSVIIGPGFWQRGSSGMIDAAYKKLRYYPAGVTGFVDVRDVSQAMILLMNSPIKNERFILNAENYTYKEFFDLAHDHFGHPRPFIKAGKLLTSLAWRYETIKSRITGKAPLLTKEMARAVRQKNYFSNEKIRAATGMEFMPVKQSIADACNSYLRDMNGIKTASPSVPRLLQCEERQL